jgi:repressor of nif and glnA expression
VDPLEAFIRAGMTSVRACCRTGHGIIGASFREVPSVAADAARAACRQMAAHGLTGVLGLGRPSMPLLEVPVAESRTGMVVVGGLNPVAALAEAGIRLTLHSLAGLEDLGRFVDINTLGDSLAGRL